MKSTRCFATATYVHNPGKQRDERITVLPGEGVGPQLIESVLKIFDHLCVPLKYDFVEHSSLNRKQENKLLKKNKWILQGPISNKTIEEENQGVCQNQILQELDIYASILNAITIPGHEAKGKDLDLLIIQQNEQQCQGHIEDEAEYEEVSSTWITPHKKSKWIAEYALENAILGRRAKISALHQANVMKVSHNEFLQNMRENAYKHSKIIYEEMLLGNAAAKLVQIPEDFDLVVLPNNCGDVFTSIAMSLVGGDSLVPSVQVGDNFTIFQQGGTNPAFEKVKGKSANPTGLILASSMMLRQLRLHSYADLLEDAIFSTFLNTKVRTKDLGGNYSTSEFTNEVIKNIHKRPFNRIVNSSKPNSQSYGLF